MLKASLGLILLSSVASATELVFSERAASGPDACPGYTVKNPKTTSSTFTADLKLAGTACNVYGPDLKNLKLSVTYETGTPLEYLRSDVTNLDHSQ